MLNFCLLYPRIKMIPSITMSEELARTISQGYKGKRVLESQKYVRNKDFMKIRAP